MRTIEYDMHFDSHQIRSLISENGIILIRGITSVEQFTEVAYGWGSVVQPIAGPRSRDLQEVSRIASLGQVSGALTWHHDQSFAESPPEWSALYCEFPGSQSVPTVFSDGSRWFDELSDGLKVCLRGLDGSHRAFYPDEGIAYADAAVRTSHPCVVRRDEREILFLSPANVRAFEAWTEGDSYPILSYLYEMLNWPEHVFKHAWSRHDVVVWDNYRFPHRALALDSGTPRVLHRVVGRWA